jgi:hypothetical protein
MSRTRLRESTIGKSTGIYWRTILWGTILWGATLWITGTTTHYGGTTTTLLGGNKGKSTSSFSSVG